MSYPQPLAEAPQSHTHMHRPLAEPQPRISLSALAEQFKLEQATIIGNASGDWQPANKGLTFIFNGTQCPEDLSTHGQVVNIANGGFAESQYAFEVQGHPQGVQLAKALTQVATDLTPSLGCWPSSGLTTVVLMMTLAQKVQVQRMSLLPSLQRSMDLPNNIHLPCMVHNWLGERRIAQTLLCERIDWPEFNLTPWESMPKACLTEALYSCNTDLQDSNLHHTQNLHHSELSHRVEDPFSQLDLLRQSTLTPNVSEQTKQQLREQLAKLARTSSAIWQQFAEKSKLKVYESLFFNHRPESQMSPWYLMDYAASQTLDAIRHQLAYCQQQLTN
ncbi:hypothetical protein [Shewanella sp.]|uniref:hypothetical protein n=1 Tax=Shewanella sp. TaxID=50422 RepID=UPI003A8C7050